MIFCRDMKALPEAGGYFDQPADVMLRWLSYAETEAEAVAVRQRIEDARRLASGAR